MNLFDELFNDFITPKKSKLTPPFVSELKNLMDSLANIKPFNPEESEEIENQLGDPDEIQQFVENDMYYVRYIWNTPHGKFVKIEVTDNPSIFETSKKEEPKSLQELLDDAVKKEDYLLAAKLRDEINGKTKTKTKQ